MARIIHDANNIARTVATNNGADGRTILNGIVAPGSTVGVEGDFYIDTVTDLIYGPKDATGTPWGTGVSIVGTMGTAGDDGDSVSVAVATNTATEYTLTITTTPGDGSAATSFTTPNLLGTGGVASGTTLPTTTATTDELFYLTAVQGTNAIGLYRRLSGETNWTAVGGGTGLSTDQATALAALPQPFVQASSYTIGDLIARDTDILAANRNKVSGTAFVAADWDVVTSQDFQTLQELHRIFPVVPTQGALSVNFLTGTETSFGFTSPTADFQLNPTEYALITVDGSPITPVIAVTNRAHNGVITIASSIPGLTAGGHTLTFQRQSEESYLDITAGVTEVDGDFHFRGNRFLLSNLPTTDPGVANTLWIDNGVPVLSGTRAPVPSTEAFSLTHDVTETETFRINLDGFRRSNEFNADADLILDLAENLGNRLLAFLAGTAAGTDGNYGETTGATVDRTTGTIDIDNTNLLTLFVNVAGNIIQLDGKEVSIDSSTDPDLFHNIRISGIDPLVDRNVPQRGAGGEVFFVRSQLEIDILTGHSTIESSDESITFDISKHNIDLTVTNPAVITSGTVATSQATSGSGSASISNGALGIVFPPSSTTTTPTGPVSELAVTTYTGIPATGTVDSPVGTRNFIEVTETQLLTIQATPSLIDTTAYYIVIPNPTAQAAAPPEPEPLQPFATSFIAGFNSPVNVSTTTSDVTITDDTVEIDLVFAVDNPGSTSNNIPTIQVPIITNDGTTIPRPTSARVALVYELDGIAQALGARATISTDGAIVLTGAFGADTTWNAIGTQTVTINIQYPNN